MNEEDQELTALYRAHANSETPAHLDARILQAARMHGWRRRNLPGIFVALALFVVFAASLTMHAPSPKPAPHIDAVAARYGMNEGRVTAFLMNPRAMRQSEIAQMPGGRASLQQF